MPKISFVLSGQAMPAENIQIHPAPSVSNTGAECSPSFLVKDFPKAKRFAFWTLEPAKFLDASDRFLLLPSTGRRIEDEG
jgi:hypothetical protein